jgi:drug/metabolite transporter (DMT)-like permease
MRSRDLLDLLLLAALWGASFLFMRVAAPEFGPFALVEVRVAIAAAVLLPLLLLRGGWPTLRAHAPRVAAVGVLNSAIPFALFSYAVLGITAGFAAILNAATPLAAALIGMLWLRERFRPAQWLGLAIGFAGVIVLVWGRVDFRPGSGLWSGTLAIGAALAATLAYGVGANYTRRYLPGVDALAIACGSQLAAAIVMLPPALLFLPAAAPSPLAWAMALLLAVASTAIAYILYFRLIAHVGAMRAAAVTFLIPAFATVWGALLLDEAVTLQMIAGGLVILAGTALTLGLGVRRRASAPT